jgi:NAD(P)-dependent dehydrogenase (short-subunit alcohol dehydrogenase family)
MGTCGRFAAVTSGLATNPMPKRILTGVSRGLGRAMVAPYCATKWAIEGLTRAVAEELPKGLAAIPVVPGIINTEMLQSCFGPEANNYPDADEWAAKAVPFLLHLGPRDNGRPLVVPE